MKQTTMELESTIPIQKYVFL